MKRAGPFAFYCQLWIVMQETAQACGYALTLHGTIRRDMDVVAVPWTPQAVSAEVLVAKLCRRHQFERDRYWTAKPHGRRAIRLLPGGQGYVDLSVMPRRKRPGRTGRWRG